VDGRRRGEAFPVSGLLNDRPRSFSEDVTALIQSPQFWLLLAVSVPIFWSLPGRYRMAFLGLVSFAYICSVAWGSALALTAWAIVFFFLAPYAVAGRWGGRRLLAILILSVLGFLAYYKYIPPLMAGLVGDSPSEMLLIPLGISYYTFKLIHYAVETARGNITDRSSANFMCYLFLFPIFTAGPIERFDHFLANRRETFGREDLVEGLSRIIQGLVKRFVLAGFIEFHALGRLTSEELVARPHYYSPALVWVYLVCFYLHVYLDFSAYSDVAIGSSRLFGLRIMENFNWPILARNIGDFWKRWHMSLGNWCQSYVYLPILGLYRKPLLSLYASLIVFSLWHEGTLTRLVWGVFHATGVALYMLWMRRQRARGVKPKPGVLHALPPMVFAQTWVILASVFLIAGGGGGTLYDAFRLFAKLVGIDIRV